LLGCGNSDKPNITYTSYLYVQLLTDFINQIIEDKTDVIASGQSASFVLATSKDNSELIDKIVLINPKSIKSLSKAPNKRSLVAGWLINTPVLGTLLYNIIHRRERLRKETHDLLSTYTDNLAISITNFSYESSHSHGGRSKHLFSSIIGNYLTSNVVHHLENSTNSIYILTGKDNETTNIAAEEYIEVLPSIEHLEINNTKELPQLEAPQEFLRHLSYFLDDIDE
jgi:pimeloyl-ACP methyl ester carboxylesterase